MPWIDTSLLKPGSQGLSSLDNHLTYCGLDCCLTLEIREELEAQFGAPGGGNQNPPNQIYSFERALQAPYLEIMQRGFLVDTLSRRQAQEDLREKIDALQVILDRLAKAIWGKGLNPRSPLQLKEFFYNELHLPEQWLNMKGERKLSTNREALEALDVYLYARPFVRSILAIRDYGKQLSVFETEIDSDNRFRAGYNIAGTETGRPSSSKNAFGTASNAQNIAPNLRYVFVADAGMKMCVIDLAQVEARDVGFFCGCLFDDWVFLDNCEQGDLHTLNAKRIWRELPWPGDTKGDREVADQQFYRDFSYRDMSKRGGHLSNYYGTAYTGARSLKVPIEVMEEFQARYVRGRPAGKWGGAIQPAFPAIPRWWRWTAEQLQLTQTLTTPFGRKRHFFGRPGDDTTLREAIAFLPQSTTADRMNLGLFRVWEQMPEVQLLAQTYDSITFQYPEGKGEEEIIRKALKIVEDVVLEAPNGRKYWVPGEAKVGWNWGAQVLEADRQKAIRRGLKPPRLNPDGLTKWSPSADLRVRTPLLQRTH